LIWFAKRTAAAGSAEQSARRTKESSVTTVTRAIAQTVDETASDDQPDRYDVVIVGAGFAGLYMLHRVRQMGLTGRILERADGVGGTWYWNRYPGARCDIESLDYQYSFDEKLVRSWRWKERYASQPEILAYLNHVADTHDLRDGITFSVTVQRAVWEEGRQTWKLICDTDLIVDARYCVMATGCLSVVKTPDFPGLADFAGPWFHTGQWPHDCVDFTGKAVAVVGTGSSGIQAIPHIAEAANRLFVLQRTPNYSMPAHNREMSDEEVDLARADFTQRRRLCENSDAGTPLPPPTLKTSQETPTEQVIRFEEGWRRGGISALSGAYTDFFTDEAANVVAQEFARRKIRETVNDRQTADLLSPRHHIGTKRTCTDTDYYATYNRDNVELIDLRSHPIETITSDGLRLDGRDLKVDSIVFAIGFDAITGAMADIDIAGTDGQRLADKWRDGPTSYLGLQVAGFPNLFMITGPGSPSVLSNMVVSIEQHVDWITDCLAYQGERGFARIEPTLEAEQAWMRHVSDLADATLYPRAESWYVGANIPGKPRVFTTYVAGCGAYRQECDGIVARDYEGFRMQTAIAGDPQETCA
jgi:cyclohexanone monooxygenase